MSIYQPDFFTPYGGDETAFVIQRPSKPSQRETHRRPTQAGRILAHLRAGNRLTALEALEKFGCFRLAARVHELRREGWHIEERTVETRGGKRVAEYSLEEAV